MNKYIAVTNENELIALQKDSEEMLYGITKEGNIFTLKGERPIKISRKSFADIFKLTIEEMLGVVKTYSSGAVVPDKGLISNAIDSKHAADVKTVTAIDESLVAKANLEKSPLDEETEVIAGEVDQPDSIETKSHTRPIVDQAGSLVTEAAGEQSMALKINPNKSVRKQIKELRLQIEDLEGRLSLTQEAVNKLIEMLINKKG